MFWDVVAFLAIAAGHAELWVTFVNRMYGLPVPIRVLHRIRGTHDIAIVAFPIIVLATVGPEGPSKFMRGEWQLLPLAWTVVFLASSVGLAGLVFAVLKWQLRTRRRMQFGSQVSVVALPRGSSRLHSAHSASDGQRTEVVSPTTKKLVRLPFNQQFELETTEKHLAPQNWPDDLDGLSILHLSDWHFSPLFSRQFFETATQAASMVRADLIVYTGDLCDDLACLDWLPQTLATLSAPLGCWFILGNHDALIDHSAIRHRMTELGWNDVGGKTTRLDVGPGRIALGGDETPWLNERPDWSDEDRSLPRVLLSHSPDLFPHHAGESVDVILAGHTHGGQIVLPVVGPVYAPSVYGVTYPSGVYSRWSTVMHVSRGLAGMHPLRFGARPEITRLLIRSPNRQMRQRGRSAANETRERQA
jgi:uncharacterized protein